MITVEQVFYCVLAHADHSELLPLARALRAVELHIRRELRRTQQGVIDQLALDNWELQREVWSLRAFKAGVDEALNSGDGVYRP